MLADVNGDGSDLILGQLRDGHAGKASQSSYVLINNGKGFFEQKIRLPGQSSTKDSQWRDQCGRRLQWG